MCESILNTFKGVVHTFWQIHLLPYSHMSGYIPFNYHCLYF